MDITPVDPKTVGKAVQLLATSHRVKVVNSVTEKSLARMQAEHSKMNAVTLLFVVAVAHFIVCDNPADGDDLPDNNWLVQLMRAYYGGLGLRVVAPTLLLAIDATTMCVCTSPRASTKGWFIASKTDTGKTRSLYTVGATGQGCYLYYHESKFKWVRSGKVCGQSTFIKRHDQHVSNSKAASVDPRSSYFYQQYPHPESPDARKDTRAGHFTDLRQYIGIGFNRDDAELLTVDRSEGGILEWQANIIDMVSKSGLGRRGATLAEKKLEMAAYLFEFVYDLMIADRDNVSGNPGFEALIGYYGEDK